MGERKEEIFVIYYENKGLPYVEAFRSQKSVLKRLDDIKGAGYKNVSSGCVELED